MSSSTASSFGDDAAHTRLLQQFWQTLKAQAEALQGDSARHDEQFVGLREWDHAPEVFIRVGRSTAGQSHVIAMTIAPCIESNHLAVRVYTIHIVNSASHVLPDESRRIRHDAAAGRFWIEGAPQDDVAKFFLDRAHALLLRALTSIEAND